MHSAASQVSPGHHRQLGDIAVVSTGVGLNLPPHTGLCQHLVGAEGAIEGLKVLLKEW